MSRVTKGQGAPTIARTVSYAQGGVRSLLVLGYVLIVLPGLQFGSLRSHGERRNAAFLAR